MNINDSNFAMTNSLGQVNTPPPKSSPVREPKPEVDAVKEAEVSKEKTLIEEIREKGFGTYVDDLKEQKREELRAKILSEMKLTEEMLAKMPPELRAKIEQTINAEIRKRMTAENELNKNKEGDLSLHNTPGLHANETQIDAAGVGIGPLLALQEIQQNTAKSPPEKDEFAG